MRAVKQVMLINGKDPTLISIYNDIIGLDRRAMKKTYTAGYKELWDNYICKELWHLGLVVLKHKKAAKVWNLRFEFILQFSAVAKFNKSSESKMENDVVFEDEDDPVSEKD